MDSQGKQEYIRAAVSFLQNPKLIDSPLQDKLKFLKDKGLTQLEIDEALNLALVNRQQPQQGRWNFLLILGLCLGGYKLYRTYLESKENYEAQQRLSKQQHQGAEKRKENQYEEKDSPTLVDILQKVTELKKLLELQRTNVASDIQSLKTLLLGHEKFAAPPVIPAWQLRDVDDKEDTSSRKVAPDTNNKGKKKNEKSRKENVAGQSTSNGFIDSTPIAPNLE